MIQGTENAGKVLTVGEDGNVTLVSQTVGATKITGLLESYYQEGTGVSWSNIRLNSYSIPHTTQSYIVVSPDGNNVYAVTKTNRSTSSTSDLISVLLQSDNDAYYQGIIKQTFRISDFSELSDGSYSVEILFRNSTEKCIPLTITFTITNGALVSFTSPINYPYVNSFNNSTKTYYVYWWIGDITITE